MASTTETICESELRNAPESRPARISESTTVTMPILVNTATRLSISCCRLFSGKAMRNSRSSFTRIEAYAISVPSVPLERTEYPCPPCMAARTSGLSA